jgi:hypothetical protein
MSQVRRGLVAWVTWCLCRPGLAPGSQLEPRNCVQTLSSGVSMSMQRVSSCCYMLT